MARIRTIKPEFFDDEEIGRLSDKAQIVFVGLWTEADREGRLEDRPERLKIRLRPYDTTCDMNAVLEELAAARFIIRYEVDGRRLIQVRTFTKHQVINVREARSVIPAPAGHVAAPAEVAEHVQTPDEHVHAQTDTCTHVGKGRGKGRELGKGTGKEGREEQENERALSLPSSTSDPTPEQDAPDVEVYLQLWAEEWLDSTGSRFTITPAERGKVAIAASSVVGMNDDRMRSLMRFCIRKCGKPKAEFPYNWEGPRNFFTYLSKIEADAVTAGVVPRLHADDDGSPANMTIGWTCRECGEIHEGDPKSIGKCLKRSSESDESKKDQEDRIAWNRRQLALAQNPAPKLPTVQDLKRRAEERQQQEAVAS